MKRKAMIGVVVGLACLAGQPSFAMSPTARSASATALSLEAAIPTSAGLHATQAKSTVEDLLKRLTQKNKAAKKKAKKPKKNPTREVPEINAASGLQALALLIGVLLLGAERLRRYS